jgi:glycerate-2-kinase
MDDQRELLTALYKAAVRSVDPRTLVYEALGRRGDAVYVRSVSALSRREFAFAPGRVSILSVGKAAVPMAVAAHEALGSRVDEALVIGPKGVPFEGLPAGFRFLAASHPYPDADSAGAGAAALSLASRLAEPDLLIVLLSGGGSALMAAPAGELTLEEKSRAIRLLMAAGAPIAELNLVRGVVSRVKAGRLALAAGFAQVVTLVLSDLGDDGWHLVASGPTLGTPRSPAEAAEIFRRYRLMPLLPPAVRHFLATAPPPAPPHMVGQRWGVLLADIRTALEGARREAIRLGLDVRVVPELLRGEARAAARRIALAGACAGNLVRRPGAPGRRLVTLFGGETTVTVKGKGRGGRNRELALAAASQIVGIQGACILVAGTDGVDHDTDAAGAFVDDSSLARAEEKGLDPAASLAQNDSGTFFERLGDSFAPGPTGTNVGDVAFALAPPNDSIGERMRAEP